MNYLKKINEKIEAWSAVLDLKINEWSKKYDLNYEGSKVKLPSELEIIETFLKRKGYVVYGSQFTKGFVLIMLNAPNKIDIESISIKHDVKGLNNKWQHITESFITGLVLYTNYYEKI